MAYNSLNTHNFIICKYEINTPQYDQSLLEEIIKFDLDLDFKVIEVKLEVKASNCHISANIYISIKNL